MNKTIILLSTALLSLSGTYSAYADYVYRSPLDGVSTSSVGSGDVEEDVDEENADAWVEFSDENNIFYSEDFKIYGLKNAATLGIADISLISGVFPSEKFPISAADYILLYGEYSDISSFSSLQNVDSLSIASHNISSVSGLSNISGVSVFTLVAGGISDISPLSSIISSSMSSITVNADYSNLSVMSGLQSVDGNADFLSPSLSDISGLSNLNAVGGDLIVGGNNNILDLTPLKDVTIGGTFYSDAEYNGPKLPSDSNFCTSATNYYTVENISYLYFSGFPVTQSTKSSGSGQKDIFCES